MKVTSETAPIIEATRETLTKWVETKQLISKEKSEWASGKDILEDRVRLAQAETTTVREKLKEISAAVAEAQKKRDELAAQNDKLKATAEKSKAMVIAAEKKLRPLLPQLPEPLREKLKPIIARFPEDSEKSNASLAERLQNVLGILDQASAFNSTVASVKELRTFPDGTRAEVTTVYLGLSQAHQREVGQTVGQMHLHHDAGSTQPHDRTALYLRKPHGYLLLLVHAPISCVFAARLAPRRCCFDLFWVAFEHKQLQVCLAQSLLSVSSTADISQFH
jgi:FtsZ-binding cell division protein ZapB